MHIKSNTEYPPDLSGRITIVTGASRGLGAAIARAFSISGNGVALLARNAVSLNKLATELASASEGKVLSVPTDITDPQAVKLAVGKVMDRFGRIDCLVNNAGAAAFKPIDELTDEDWHSQMKTNLDGTFYLTRAVLPIMKASGRGHIFNIISTAAREVFPGCGAYGAAKAGVLAFTNVLREECREHKIRVTAVIPGPMHTPIWDGLGEGWDFDKMMDPASVAQTMVDVLNQPGNVVVEELFIRPQTGNL